jgi:glyoxylase I family protein
MARWYVVNCHMKVVLSLSEAPHTHFLADETGRTVMEIYSNPSAPVPDYASMPPLCFHCAFATDDPVTVKERLVSAGAAFIQEHVLPDGSVIIGLRDPWGVPLQLCSRTQPLP